MTRLCGAFGVHSEDGVVTWNQWRQLELWKRAWGRGGGSGGVCKSPTLKPEGSDGAAASTAAAAAPSALSAWRLRPKRLALCGALGQVEHLETERKCAH